MARAVEHDFTLAHGNGPGAIFDGVIDLMQRHEDGNAVFAIYMRQIVHDFA